MYDDCPVGESEFVTVAAWRNHHFQMHSCRYFCPFSCTQEFRFRASLEDHMVREHNLSPDPMGLKGIIDSLGQSGGIEFWDSHCPICNTRLDWPSGVDSLYATTVWHQHVASHLEELAFLTLSENGLITGSQSEILVAQDLTTGTSRPTELERVASPETNTTEHHLSSKQEQPVPTTKPENSKRRMMWDPAA